MSTNNGLVSEDSVRQILQQQNALIAALTERLESLETNKAKAPPKLDDTIRMIPEFICTGNGGETFDTWFKRYKEVFATSLSTCNEATKVYLLLGKLGADERRQYVECVRPARPHEKSFEETVDLLSQIFSSRSALFRIRYQCLQTIKGNTEDYSTYKARVDRNCENFGLEELTLDQFKCLMFVCGLKSPNSSQLRARLLSIIETKPHPTLQMLCEECLRTEGCSEFRQKTMSDGSIGRSGTKPSYTSRSAILPRVLQSKPPSACRNCGEWHFVKDCPLNPHTRRQLALPNFKRPQSISGPCGYSPRHTNMPMRPQHHPLFSPSLANILAKYPENFEHCELGNTALVVNGLDFKLWTSKGLHFIYGGEYLAYTNRIRRVLNIFNQCEITPYFIFSGCRPDGDILSGRQLGKFAKSLTGCAESRENTTDDGCGQSPIFAKQALVDILTQLNKNHLTVPYSAVPPSAALAAFLSCPVAGFSSEYYVMTSVDTFQRGAALPPYNLKFAPLNRVCLKVFLKANEGGLPTDCFISADLFKPEVSILHRISPQHRPLFGVLYGINDTLSIRPPKQVYTMRMDEISVPPDERQLHSLVKWLGEFQSGSSLPLRELLNCNAESYKSQNLTEIKKALTQYLYNPAEEGEKMAACFQIPSCRKATEACEDSADANAYQKGCTEKTTSDNCEFWEILSAVQPKVDDYTVGWPPHLSDAFRNGMIMPSLLAPLYGSGLLLPCKNEDLGTPLSVQQAALPMRTMHYRILSGLEHRLHHQAKLVGLNPYANEYVRYLDRLVSYAIPVEPLEISQESAKTDEFLSSFFHSPLIENPTDPEWLFSLSVMVGVWHNFCVQNGETASLDQSSVILATALCAVLTANELYSGDEGLVQHYDERAASIESETTRTLGSSAPKTSPFRPDIVHAFAAMQVIYATLRSLVNLIDSLLPPTQKSQIFHFLPFWAVFPSGRLAHWLAIDIEAQPPDKRYHHTKRFWLPRICRCKTSASSAEEEFGRLNTLFSTLISTALELDVKLNPVTYEMHEVHLPEIGANGADNMSCSSSSHRFGYRQQERIQKSTPKGVVHNSMRRFDATSREFVIDAEH
ncbi:unnamed protein product [Calicophoron daubneyi]|uniref:DUF7083 domain-containing protein n=1 Tax=Calicophoron daubneyi TaxID=300641 RepID=A0AAV2TXF3_CALDB